MFLLEISFPRLAATPESLLPQLTEMCKGKTITAAYRQISQPVFQKRRASPADRRRAAGPTEESVARYYYRAQVV